MAAQHHLIAQSSNGSLFAVYSSNSSSVIRCYDGSVSNGSLKFTLRIPPPPTRDSSSSSFGGDQEASNNDPIRKLVFATPSSLGSSSSSSSSRYLCALREYTILVFDLERGVVSHTLNIRDDLSGGGKKGRKSSISGNDQTKAVVCDAALTDDDDQLCVLVLFPSSGEGGGKCRIYQYDLTAASAADSSSGLKRKIKVGSVSGTTGDQLPSFGVDVSSSSSNKKGDRVIAIRMNDGLRICDYHSGEKVCKSTIPNNLDGGSMMSSLRLSTCSRYLAATTKNQIVLYKLENDQSDAKKKSTLKIIAQLSCEDDSTISHVELVKKKDGLTVLAFQPTAATASLFSCDDDTSSFDSSLPPQLPKAKLRCDQGGDSSNIALIHSALHSRRPQEEILVLFQNISSKGSNASLPMQSISYDDSIEGTVTVGTELSAEIANDANNKKKRKASSSVALAPGDQGNEASLAVDLTSKKARKEKEGEGSEEGDGDFQIEDEDEGDEKEQSIAERLALLSSAMAESDDEEDEEEEDDDEEEDGKDAAAAKKSKFKLKSATSETLTTLLAQALSSNDSVQLNIALQVTDRRLVEGTVRSLQALDAERVQSGESASSSTGYMSMLMGHIVRRMARRHSLVVPLGVWVKAILAATSRAAATSVLHPNRDDVEEQIAKEAREIALKLGPLRNFLNERVECFPQLLRLEGRLALLSEQL